MERELEQQSFLLGKKLQHPTIPFVKIFGKTYYCDKHSDKHPNSGGMRQHIEGPDHELDFETGKPLKLDKAGSLAGKGKKGNTKSRKAKSEIDQFNEMKIKLEAIFPNHNSTVKFLLANYGLKGELKRIVIQNLLVLEADSEANKKNMQPSKIRLPKSMPSYSKLTQNGKYISTYP